MQLYTIENTNNKCHEIILYNTSIFTSYEAFIGLKTGRTLFINRYYVNYSMTTSRHINAMLNEYDYKNIIYVTSEEFNRLFMLLENNQTVFNQEVEALETKAETQFKDLQTIEVGEVPAISESETITQELKTRKKIICHHTTPAGVKFKTISTQTKAGKEIKFQVKLNEYQNLLCSY